MRAALLAGGPANHSPHNLLLYVNPPSCLKKETFPEFCNILHRRRQFPEFPHRSRHFVRTLTPGRIIYLFIHSTLPLPLPVSTPTPSSSPRFNPTMQTKPSPPRTRPSHSIFLHESNPAPSSTTYMYLIFAAYSTSLPSFLLPLKGRSYAGDPPPGVQPPPPPAPWHRFRSLEGTLHGDNVQINAKTGTSHSRFKISS